MSKRAAITGIGCVSPLGYGLSETVAALRTGRDGIRAVDLFSTAAFRAKTAGLLPPGLDERAAAVTPDAVKWPRSARMLILAVHEALAARPDFVPDTVIAATTSGGMDFGEMFYRNWPATMNSRHARSFVRRYVPHQPALDVLGHFGFHPPVRVVSNACASGTNALGLGARLVRTGRAQRVLVVGFDAMAEMVFAGFDALQASTPEMCRPFDRGRSGLALGEAAAAFLIEADASEPLAILTGYGCANDNFHLTKPEPGGAGPRLSMQRALGDAGRSAAEIDYINAHGTGTPFNDASEAAAIREVCPNAPVSSTKGLTGHALGAAGAIEAVFCILAMREGFLPPNINLRDPEPGLNLVANQAREVRPQTVLSNSFGFGGSNATIVLEAA
ncbi:MAG: beta-ketoacyl-[acyl-carrier-protein] synthase family protein [Terrimicrobiaceae bacterium]|nr:beta-ketoacyl-[acyl-carrier-protein] synthase family protein [Terrimicrobiaceae bacterium]